MTEELMRVEWIGNRLAAPGPGKDGILQGDVLRESKTIADTEPNSIKVKWDNGRITIERRANLKWIER
jgi:hypothetical protein